MLDAAMMTLMLIVALYFFVKVMRVKVGVLLKCQPEVRWDRVQDRIVRLVRFGLAQKRLFKEPAPGLMHALIFWGFLVLLVRSITLIGRAYNGGHLFGGWSVLGFSTALDHFYSLLKDITEVVVLVMVCYAAFRRLVTRPERLTLSPSGLLILALIAILMISDLVYDGARFALGRSEHPHIAAEALASPVGSWIASWLAASPRTLLVAINTSMYWLHIATLLYFLNELPRSKHFHVIVALPNVFFSRLDPPGAIRPIEDIEEQESFGVARPTDLTWKQVLDGYACTECGRCSVNCPAHLSGKPLNPKLLIDETRDFVKRYEHLIAGDSDLPEGTPTLPDHIGEDVIWSCTTCRSCEENCPLLITHVDKIVDYRRYLVLMEGRVSDDLNVTMRNLENKSNPWGLAQGARAEWVSQLEVPLLSQKGKAEHLFFLGCFASYDDRNIKVAKALVELLRRAKVDFAVLGAEEACCGDPARRLGNEYLYQIQAQQNIETFGSYGVEKVVTACPHCMNTLKNEYPQFGGHYEVWHHAEFLKKLIADGRLDVGSEDLPQRVVFHDSCYLGRYNGIYDAPREILQSLEGMELIEVERSREDGLCCGAGGGLMFKEEKIENRMSHNRLDQLHASGAETIATACPFCLVMLRDAINEKGLEETCRIFDVAEILHRRVMRNEV